MRKNKPSRTAYKVAMSLVSLGAKPEMEAILPPGLVQATEKLLVASGIAGTKIVQLAASARMVAVNEAFYRILPGQFEAFAYRKAFCERHTREGIQSGAEQVLVLGAGFDTLGWRLAPEFAHVHFFEIDHPATAEYKERGIKAMGRSGNLYLIPEDLGKQKLVDVLSRHDTWDSHAQTVIIAEGLVMYLTPDAVRDLFRQCADATGDGSRIVFSYIPADKNDRPDAGKWTWLMLWLQSLLKEPWLWSIQHEKLGAFLKQNGWTLPPFSEKSQEEYGVEYFIAAYCCPAVQNSGE